MHRWPHFLVHSGPGKATNLPSSLAFHATLLVSRRSASSEDDRQERLGGTFEPVAYQPRQAQFSFGQATTQRRLTRDDGLDFALGTLHKKKLPVDSGKTDPFVCRIVLATRKPMLLLRFAGWFLLRLAERRFCALLLNDPPRNTRLVGRRPLERDCSQ
jgi:hypothetical protein